MIKSTKTIVIYLEDKKRASIAWLLGHQESGIPGNFQVFQVIFPRRPKYRVDACFSKW